MFEFTKWTLFESSNNETENYDKMCPAIVRPPQSPLLIETLENSQEYTEMGIIRQFPFSSSLQRMSVIVKSLNASHFDLFTKGSPEKICELSRKETSIF